MDNENQLDSIDELLFGYFEYEPEEIVPQAIKNLAKKAVKKAKVRNSIRQLNKIAIAIITIGIMTTGIVFDKDIVNFITSLFTNSTPAIDTAVQNGYVQNVDMDYVYDNNIGIKVESLIIDDFNLDVAFSYEYDNENVELIELGVYSIWNENNDLIYKTSNDTVNKVAMANYIIKNNPAKRLTSNTYIESILFNLVQNRQKINELYFKVDSFRVIKNEGTIENINGNWKFKVSIANNMKNSNNILYDIVEREDIRDFSAIMTETGLILEVDLDVFVETENFKEKYNFILENSLKEEFEPYLVEYIDNSTIKIYYNNINTCSNNIDKFILHLKINENQTLDLNLKKRTN